MVNEQEYVHRAYNRFVERGVGEDELTWQRAELMYQCEEEMGFVLTPEEAVDEELLYAAENQG